VHIEVKIDANCPETRVTVIASEMTDEVSELVKKISEHDPSILIGFQNSEAFILDRDNIIRFYASMQKVFAVTKESEYIVRLKLYELEQALCSSRFVRISNSEIINLQKVAKFDLSLSGTIYVKFKDGSATYASRRYVSKIKQILGI